jgi:hypothetical protein
MHAQFLRIKKLTGKAIIQVAARHNLREIAAEIGAGDRIDPTRIADNTVLRGADTAGGVARMAKALIDEAGITRLRKDAVMALEIIFSLPPETTVDQGRYFSEATLWAEQHFGVPILSSIVHRDEAAPHCHVLLLPLTNGRMIGSDLLGGKTKLSAMQADFHSNVGRSHGLARQPSKKRHSATVRTAAIAQAFDVLNANSGLNSTVLRALLAPHVDNPEPLLIALGLPMPAPNVTGSFVATMTRKMRKEKSIGFGCPNPIGFDSSPSPKKEQTLSCVGFTNSATSISPPNEPPKSASKPAVSEPIIASNADDSLRSARVRKSRTSRPVPVSLAEPQERAGDDNSADGSDGDYVRERDGDQDAQHWNPDTGEFIAFGLPSKPSRKALVASSIRASVDEVMSLKDGRERDRTRHHSE